MTAAFYQQWPASWYTLLSRPHSPCTCHPTHTRIVPEKTAFVVERFGRFHKVLNSGLRFLIPLVRAPWRQLLL
jgi:hypothetical protein